MFKCPHCHKGFRTIVALMPALEEGEEITGIYTLVYYPTKFILHPEKQPRRVEAFKCPKCEETIANPENCLKPYAI